VLDSLIHKIVKRHRKKPGGEKDAFKARLLEFQIGPYAWLIDLPARIFFGSDLKMLATIYGTDKWNHHWLAQHYQELLSGIRRRRINFLEIGVGGDENPRDGGKSLRMWRAFFPKARIYGIDINDKRPHDRGRIRTFKGSQADAGFLDAVVQEIGRIDVILDDGSHLNSHMIFTFQRLFPHLAAGGYYIVEDTQTSYWPGFFEGQETDRNDPATAMGYFKSLADGLNWREFKNRYTPNYFDLHIESIAFYHNMLVIRKKAEGEVSQLQAETASGASA
jgi:cephalosporin hydroxylase